ncbi:MAG: DUF481 domain-containing protein [Candidatus Aminicenantes bacterium]|nr:MAG: DUF481 domain-containing protein [Candidatus Aminicenantes bacterium]
MKRSRIIFFLLVWIFCALTTTQLSADDLKVNVDELKEAAPKVFLDCRRCDRDYFREEITYINYVRDRKDADIHVLVTEQSTGSGGREYTFAFIGLNQFAGLDNTLTYSSGPNDTRDEIRKGQVEVMKRGIFPYVLNTPIAEHIYLSFRQKLEPTAVKDPWNFWVFSISGDARISGESSRTSRSLDVNISANRVTPDWKIRLGLSGEFDKRTYDYEDEYIESISEEKNATSMVVKSINDHWSVGGWVEAESNTYSNLDLLFTIAPALEYNIWPYDESTRRQLRIMYRIGFNHANYMEETIYEKMSEILFNQSLTVTLAIREPWGSISTSLEGSHYFHDFKMNRLEWNGFLDIRLFKGLSLDIYGRYDLVHDQLSLPIGDASLDEVLLARKELLTSYDYSISVGLRYTFGSVYSNVVNPRFGRTRYRGRGRF